MGNLPLYKGCLEPKDTLHCGLLFDKFCEWKELREALKDQDKKGFLEKLKGECGSKSDIEAYAIKQLSLIDSLGGAAATFTTQWHFVTGMGIDHPLENGLAWHPTLGTPYIAGSGVKGLFRAYLWEWTDVDKKQILKWCGYTKEEAKEHGFEGESTGELIFFDAIPVEPVMLTPDVMTPHMGDWYEKGGSGEYDAKNTPADWHNPVPIQFLAVKKATFLFGIAARIETAKGDVENAMRYLGEALEWIGAGAKTATGYGRFCKKREHKIFSEYKKEREEAAKRAKEEQKAKELSKLPLFDRIFAQFGDDVVKLIEALEKNEFGDNTKKAAIKIKEIMISKKVWKPDVNPNKHKSAKRTKIVQKILGE